MADFINTFSDQVDPGTAMDALQTLKQIYQEHRELARHAKTLVMEVFLLKGIYNYNKATQNDDASEAEKSINVVERQLAFLPGNILDMTGEEFQPVVLKTARALLEPKAQSKDA